MPTLYEISGDLHELETALTLSEGEVDPILEEWFADIQSAKDEKIDAYCRLIKEMQARAVARDEEAERLRRRAQIDNNAVDRMKRRLLDFCVLHNFRNIHTGNFALIVAKNGGKLPLKVDAAPDQLPDEFVKVIREADNLKIREALEAGADLPFARFGERGIHLQIR